MNIESATPTQRLFIAIALPERVRNDVARLSDNLQKGMQFTKARPSWAQPESMHVTLVFMGQKSADRVEAIGAAIEAAARGFAPLAIEIKELGVFPHWRRPRVLWVGVHDRTRQIQDLHHALESAIGAFDYQPEDRPYHPHLTLARFKSQRGAKEAESIVKSHAGFKSKAFDAMELILFKSELHPAGAIHTPLHRVRFNGGGDDVEKATQS